MQSRGLGEAQIEDARGYADTRLRFADAPLHARNRRVSILVRRLEETGSAPTQQPPPAAPGNAGSGH